MSAPLVISPRVRSFLTLISLSLMFACDDPVSPAVSVDGLQQLGAADREVTPPSPPPMPPAPPPPIDRALPRDSGPAPDQGPAPDRSPLDQSVAADRAVLDGDIPEGEPCDPRLRSTDCEQGFTCYPVPGGRVSDGRCVMGEGCIPGEPCPVEGEQCYPWGRGTYCAPPGERGLGEACRDDFERSLPCAEGLFCNGSVCVPSCVPGAPETGCPNDGRCVDWSEHLGVPFGLCSNRGCDPFANLGCAEGEKCQFAVRNDGVLIGFCQENGGEALDAPCGDAIMSRDICDAGLYCIGTSAESAFCRELCDVAGVEHRCPQFQGCQEVIRGQAGRVRGIGICIVNP